MISGAWGGRPDKDGIEAITNPSQNLSNMPVEVTGGRASRPRSRIMRSCPTPAAPADSRGGVGSAAHPIVCWPRRCCSCAPTGVRFAPYGLDGGEPGGVAGNWLGEGNAKRAIPGKVTMTMQSGELVTHHQAGGGGHGDPFVRAPEAVASDVWNGKVTVEAARTRYGVAVDAGGVVDAAKTAQLRLRRNG